MGLSSLSAPWISPYDPNTQDLLDRLSSPTSEHLMGTDQYGRDFLSRVLWGGRVSLAIGLLAMFIGVGMSVLIGATSGYFGRLTDTVLMRITELMFVFPVFFLIILVTATFGNSLRVLILTLGLTSWVIGARIMRGEVLKVSSRDYILAAQSVGATDVRIIIHHILPNVASIIIVSATVSVPSLILVEAGISFIGLGVQPPTASWGNMISDAAFFLRQAWWQVGFAGLAILITVTGFNIMGEGLRDMLGHQGQK